MRSRIGMAAAAVLLLVGLLCFVFKTSVAALIRSHATGAVLVLAASIVVVGLGFVVWPPRRMAAAPAFDGGWLARQRLLRALALAVIFVLVVMTIAVFVYQPPRNDRLTLIELAFVAAFAGVIAFAELMERYRDDPLRLFAADPTIIYMGVNIAASVAALALIKDFKVFDETKSDTHAAIYEVLLAAFGSIAFFRSSLFTARVAGKDVDVGPATLLKSLLETSDRMINRSQARYRADDAASIMADVDWAKARAALPSFCFTAVEGMSQEDKTLVATQINQLKDDQSMSDPQRSAILGILLMRSVGPIVLARAVNALGDSIKPDRPAVPPSPARTATRPGPSAPPA